MIRACVTAKSRNNIYCLHTKGSNVNNKFSRTRSCNENKSTLMCFFLTQNHMLWQNSMIVSLSYLCTFTFSKQDFCNRSSPQELHRFD